MKIHSPSFSGSISQALSAYADLSGSFTGSFTGSFKGVIDVEETTFQNLTIVDTLKLGTDTDDVQSITGSIFYSGSMEGNGNINLVNNSEFQIEGENVLDTALAFAIALG